MTPPRSCSAMVIIPIAPSAIAVWVPAAVFWATPFHLLRTILTPALIIHTVKAHPVATPQHTSVDNFRAVAKEVFLVSGIRLYKTEAARIPFCAHAPLSFTTTLPLSAAVIVT